VVGGILTLTKLRRVATVARSTVLCSRPVIHPHLASARTGHKPLRIALSAALLTGVIALSPISPLSTPSVSAADVWSVPEDLSAGDAVTALPQVSTDADGTSVAVWLRETVPGQTPEATCDAVDKCIVEAAHFDEATESWSDVTELSSDLENATQADVLINGSGEAMAIWRSTDGPDTVIQASVFDGTNWDALPTDVSGTVGNPRGPQLSVSPAGVFTVVWYRAELATNVIESSQWNGTTWSPIETVSLGATENAEISRVVADNDGDVIALWQGQLAPAGPYYVRAARFTGGAWSAPATVSAPAVLAVGDTLAPQLAIDGAGNATAAWHQSDGTTTLIHVSRYDVLTDTWGAPQPLSAAGGNAVNPRVESDTAGNVTALWRRFDSAGYAIIQTSRYSAATGTWGPVVALSTSGRQSQSQRLAVDALGNVTAVWRRNNSVGNSIIQSARYTPSTNTWGAARDLSAPGQNAVSPATDVDANGNVIVVWARSNGTVPVIQASRSTNILGFVAVDPIRVFDTRPDNPDGVRVVNKVKVGGLYELSVKLSDITGVTPPTGVGAVSLNVTVVDPDAAGFVTLYPCDTRSEVSNVNFLAGQTVANAVIAPVSADGNVCFFSNTPAHILADLNGYFPSNSGYTAVSPRRVFDTRPNESPGALLGDFKAPIGGSVEVMADMLGLPNGVTPASGVSAVSLNVTVTNPVASGFITVYPCDQELELVSSVNFVAGQTVANAVIAPLAADGTICFHSNVQTDIIVDISGWFPSESGYAAAASPARVFDTRPGESPGALRDVPKVKIGGLTELKVDMTSLTDITPPLGVAAVSLNVTVTNPVGSGFVTVYPCGTRPLVSSVNFIAGQTVANAVIAPLSDAGELCFFSNLGTDLVVDINGFFAA
jgi:hypothetical protein